MNVRKQSSVLSLWLNFTPVLPTECLCVNIVFWLWMKIKVKLNAIADLWVLSLFGTFSYPLPKADSGSYFTHIYSDRLQSFYAKERSYQTSVLNTFRGHIFSLLWGKIMKWPWTKFQTTAKSKVHRDLCEIQDLIFSPLDPISIRLYQKSVSR